MKKTLLALVALFATTIMFGQTVLPNDPAVRVGKLENGMTYYIRHNAEPAQRAEFYLATNVGAFQETDDQDGLAHFLEHMCFNGTKNFPGKSLLNYLESIGAQFGGNINAMTGFEQTSYMLNNIPIVREGIIDSCLLVMHDYSHFVLCEPEEIDAERGVIIEERRSRRNASWRMFEASLPYRYGDTPYAKRTLIGSEEQLRNFAYESLTNFYHTWYTPDKQALIVVGDVDVDQIENKIKTIFADIPAGVPAEKIIHQLPQNEEPVIGILTDREASNSKIEIFWKTEPIPTEFNNTLEAYTMSLLKYIVSGVMSERFDDISSQPDAPFLGSSFYISKMCNASDAVMGYISHKDGEAVPALKAFLVEVEKMKRFGFTDAEVERVKTQLISFAEREVEAAATKKNAEYVQPLLNNFFHNEPFLEPATELEIIQMLCQQMTPMLINQVLKEIIPANNLVIITTAPEREGLVQPTEAEILATLAEVKSMDIKANAAEEITEPLIDAKKLKGSKSKKMTKGQFGETTWELKNGVRVVVLPTTYRNDEVTLQLVKDGGLSLVAEEDLPSMDGTITSLFINNSGVGKFSNTQLKKMLAGKQVSVTPFIGTLANGISASSTPKDLETAFQLMYMMYCQPRFDQNEYDLGINQLKAYLPNMVAQPQYKFQQILMKTVFGENTRRKHVLSEEIIEKANLQTFEKVYRSLFNDAAGLTLYVVGNVDVNTVKPLIEKYVGSIKKGKKAPKWIDNEDRIAKGEVINHTSIEMETPKSTVFQFYTIDTPYSVEKSVLYDAAKAVLDILYVETLRESEGGTYGASVAPIVQQTPYEYAGIQVFFETNPEQAENLAAIARTGIEEFIINGIDDTKMDKVIENFKKNIPENRIQNWYWRSVLKQWYEDGINYDVEYEAAVNSLSEDKVREVFKELLGSGNFIELIVSPSEK